MGRMNGPWGPCEYPPGWGKIAKRVNINAPTIAGELDINEIADPKSMSAIETDGATCDICKGPEPLVRRPSGGHICKPCAAKVAKANKRKG